MRADTRMALWPAALCAAQTGRTHDRTNQRCRGPQTLAKGELSTQVDLTRSPIVPNDLRLRGPSGAKDKFLLAATAQNLRKLAKLIPLPAPIFAT